MLVFGGRGVHLKAKHKAKKAPLVPHLLTPIEESSQEKNMLRGLWLLVSSHKLDYNYQYPL